MMLPLLAADPPKLVDLWPMALPLVAGAAAVYLLLPRPRPFPTLYGALLGGLALVLGGFLLIRLGAASPERVLFYAFSFLAVVSGAWLVTLHNPAHAALSFAVVVLSTCGLFLLLAAPFLMAATIIVYAGAIIVTFLFVIMLAQQTGQTDADLRSREPLLAAVTGFVLLAALLFVVRSNYYDGPDLEALLARVRATSGLGTKEQYRALNGDTKEEKGLKNEAREAVGRLGMEDLDAKLGGNDPRFTVSQADPSDDAALARERQALEDERKGLEEVLLEAHQRVGLPQPNKDPEKGVDRLSPLSGPGLLQQRPGRELRRDADGRPAMPAENAAYLGRSLFTDYLLAVELGGVLLLVAVIGAVVIAYRRDKPEKPE
jgi:NADH:ubiquinone oxidoreductase subunit 6 (subunit J)